MHLLGVGVFLDAVKATTMPRFLLSSSAKEPAGARVSYRHGIVKRPQSVPEAGVEPSWKEYREPISTPSGNFPV